MCPCGAPKRAASPTKTSFATTTGHHRAYILYTLHNRPFVGENRKEGLGFYFYWLTRKTERLKRFGCFQLSTSSIFSISFSFCLPFFNIMIVKSSVNWMYHDLMGRRLRDSLWRIMLCVTCSFLFSSSSIRLLCDSFFFLHQIFISFSDCPSVRPFFFLFLSFFFYPPIKLDSLCRNGPLGQNLSSRSVPPRSLNWFSLLIFFSFFSFSFFWSPVLMGNLSTQQNNMNKR